MTIDELDAGIRKAVDMKNWLSLETRLQQLVDNELFWLLFPLAIISDSWIICRDQIYLFTFSKESDHED